MTPQQADAGRIVVGCDGSPSSADALDWAARQAAAHREQARGDHDVAVAPEPGLVRSPPRRLRSRGRRAAKPRRCRCARDRAAPRPGGRDAEWPTATPRPCSWMRRRGPTCSWWAAAVTASSPACCSGPSRSTAPPRRTAPSWSTTAAETVRRRRVTSAGGRARARSCAPRSSAIPGPPAVGPAGVISGSAPHQRAQRRFGRRLQGRRVVPALEEQRQPARPGRELRRPPGPARRSRSLESSSWPSGSAS